MTIPVIPEHDVIQLAANGQSLARYGDGELRLCVGGDAKAQRVRDPKLVDELRTILKVVVPNLIVCIPDFNRGPRIRAWRQYLDPPKYAALYSPMMTYGSAFVSRPDSAPWIDTPDYWKAVRSIWLGKAVVLVAGALDKSLDPQSLLASGAREVGLIEAPRENAYREIDRIERMLDPVPPSVPVLICLGPTATVLAWRLAKKGKHALDLGHIGMFMKRNGELAA